LEVEVEVYWAAVWVVGNLVARRWRFF